MRMRMGETIQLSIPMMLSRVIRRTGPFLRSNRLLSAPAREYNYFDNFSVVDGIGIVRLNGPDRMNVISAGMQKEAQELFRSKILNNNDVKAVVFISSKEDNFIAGADINMLKAVENKAELKDMCMRGHLFFDEVKSSKKPLIAAINGACLGGGLEWAMYCDYRIASSSPKTQLGLVEVKIGLLPGMAGTYHLPKLIGYTDALDMILTGKTIRPEKARKLGLVSLVVDPAALETVAIEQAKGIVAGKVKLDKPKSSYLSLAIQYIPPVRDYVFNKAKETVDKQSGGHYPSPYKIIEVIKNNIGKSRMQHLEDEATKFAELASTPQSEALIGLFNGSTAVKKHSFGKPQHEVRNVAVLGAGLMGGGIAQVSVDNGKYRVFMKDRDLAAVSKGEGVIDAALRDKVKKKRMSNYEYSTTSSRLIPLYDAHEAWRKHFAQADMVIEAVFEELGVKHAVLREMEEVVPAHCVFASNTSAIPIGKIAEGAKRPENVIGMHYFSPVPLMPLLEVIAHAGTAPAVVASAMAVGSRQGKTPILVKDVPGFFVNRALSPMMSEVTALVHEGVDLETLDKAMKSFGMPVGPITLSDEVGIDVSNHVGRFMRGADLGDRMRGGDPAVMERMVERGLLGRKTGKGFYLYPKDGKKKAAKQLNPEALAIIRELNGGAKASLSVEEIQMRIISRFVNEAAFCLQDGIIRSPVDGDIGSVFGIGFPPFLGGPFRMLDSQGTQKFIDRMYVFRDSKGPQFEPCQLLKDYAAAGKKFHS